MQYINVVKSILYLLSKNIIIYWFTVANIFKDLDDKPCIL